MPFWKCCDCSDDPLLDTVKVDPEQMKRESEEEQARSLKDQEALDAVEREVRIRELQLRQYERQQAEEARRRERQRRQLDRHLAEEVRRREEAVERRRRREARALKREQEEKAKAEQEAREEEERLLAEEKAEQDRAAKVVADTQKLDGWMKAKNLQDVTTKKSLGLFAGSAFPLHLAVMDKDADMVRILLANRADPTAVSSNLTPLQFAEKLARKDYTKSYEAVKAALQ